MRHSILPNLYLAQTAVMLSGARRVAMLLAVMMLTMTTQTAWADSTFSGGDGSSGNPYKISNTADLNQLASDVNGGNGYSGKYFKLTANITYDGTANNFTPIGNNMGSFYGTFDGDGKTISGININSGDAEYQGIFGLVDGNVKNLVVSNCSIVGLQFIGVIAGALRRGTIENCHVGNDVTLSSGNAYYAFAGGIVGESEGGTIKGCTCAATITSTYVARILGGIVGATYEFMSTSSSLTDNIFTGTITGNLKEYIGAIVGQNNNGTLTNNHYTSTGFGGIGAAGSTTGADGEGATALDWATQSNGNSEATAYMIYNKEQLDLLAHRVNGTHGETANDYSGKYFKLGADIEYDYTGLSATESNYTAIGDNSHQFAGIFDGNGKTISGIRIYKGGKDETNHTDDYQGLFGKISSTAEVKNVTLANATITGYKYIGGIVGYSDQGNVTDCHVLSDVTFPSVQSYAQYHGGIVGYNDRVTTGNSDHGIVTGCTSAAAFKHVGSAYNTYNIGGIVGYNQLGTVSQCIYLGTTLQGDHYVGAIVGYNNLSTVTNCYFTSTTIQGKNSTTILDNAESAVGYNREGAVSNCGLAHKVTLGEGITLGGTATEHGLLTVYGNVVAMGYNDGTSTTLYSKSGNVITLGNYSGTTPEGYTFGGYTAKDADNGDVTVTKTSGGYTFTMPAKDVTVSAILTAIPWSGSGDSADDPYIILYPSQLDLLAAQVNAGNYEGKFFKLGDNIEYDGTEKNFTPIGDNNHTFYGTFDGDGKTISGININSDAQYQGIFGLVDGNVKNLVVSNCSIAGRHSTGVIAGALRRGTIENCHVDDDVTLSGNQNVGGIVGISEGGTIKGCTSAATITGTFSSGWNAFKLGGIVGATYEYASTSSTLTDNIFTGTINGVLEEYIGAIVGQNSNGTLTNNLYTSTGFGGIGAAGSTTGADGAGARKALTISAATGVTITPTGAATTYDVSGITVYADNSCMGYGGKLYACTTEAAKLSIAYTVPSGYEFNKIDAGEGVTVTASGNAYTITMPASDVTVDVDFDVIEYTLQYNGIDQATFVNSNPTTYTVESNAITLVNPTRTGYTFAGWTGTGLDAATMTVTIAKGSTGAKSYTATWKKLLTNTDIKVSAIADQTYTGSAFTPSVTVMDGETDITDQCDFTYSDNTNAGTATVTVTAKTAGNYSGEIKTTFNIVAKTVSTLTITLSATEYVYDGQAKEPAVSSVKVGDTVIPASEYTVAYENNTKAGTATVKIVDKDGGNYTVSGSATFEIVLMGDANGDRKVDAADIVKLVKDGASQSDIDAVVKIIMKN